MALKTERIGILTYHNTTNYGATLQAYALQKRLTQLGADSEIIDYRPKKAAQMYRRALIPSRMWVQNVLKILAFARFRKEHLVLSSSSAGDIQELVCLAKNYSKIIFGSDEIWNIESFRGFDEGFFLPFEETKNVEKFSYAASAGATKSFGSNQSKVANALKLFKEITVRDEFTQSLLQAECDLCVERVIDPTLLVDFNELTCTPVEKKPYVLVYGTLSTKEVTVAREIAQKLDCSIVSIGEFNHCADKNIMRAGVRQWLGLMNNAEFVLTSFFHGAIFAWKFGKPFIFLRRASKTAKFDGFAKDLALLGAPYLDGAEAEHGQHLVEYTSSSDSVARLEAAKAKADLFLLKCCA